MTRASAPAGDPPPRLGSPPVNEPHHRPPRCLLSVLALVLLAGYVLVPALAGGHSEPGRAALLPSTTGAVLVLCVWELTLFALVFGVAAWLGRIRSADLWLGWRGGAWVIPRALAWSLALRFGCGAIAGVAAVLWQVLRKKPLSELQGLRPQIESLVPIEALANPVYLVLMLTMVSFVLAGLREELWRAGMLALLGRVLPRWFGEGLGRWAALLPVALLFGLAHSAQGVVGVVVTSLLGIGLGAILLVHRSLWDAVLAHGFFNATTFAILPWLAGRLPPLPG